MLDDADPMLSVLSELKELNVSLDIDDFGIGYSSLRSLHRFPIDSLKIDRSFIEKLHIRRESEEIVRTILALAQNIGVSVVAEGVESPEELATLKKLNCEMAQGHLFSAPLLHDQITELIEGHRYPVLSAQNIVGARSSARVISFTWSITLKKARVARSIPSAGTNSGVSSVVW